MTDIVVASFYKFTPLSDYEKLQAEVSAAAHAAGTRGTILVAPEGINGTVAGERKSIDALMAHLKTLPGCQDLSWKESTSPTNPFHRMKVKLKKEIVTMGVNDIEPHKSHERYISPHEWNHVITDPDTIVIDTRNDYEVSIGTFEGAINPKTTSFREFPDWFRQFRTENNIKKVAMFCTGGIRCEKSTAFLRSEGVEDVVHLAGGILKYLETVSEEESLWRGECFVFDQRVSVGHDLAPGSYDQCHACRRPITEKDKASLHYVEGVSCPACINEYSEEKKRAFAERQKQVELAEKRGEQHIGTKNG